MIKAVIFDIDGVLIDSKEANIALYQKLLVKAGYRQPTREEALECFHLPLRPSIKKLTGVENPEEIERIAGLVYSPDLKTNHLFIFPEKLEEVLERLHRKYRLGIVTSRIRHGVDMVFEMKDIERFFDVIVAFEDYQNPKPHPEPLLVALKRLNLKPEEAIYIGDGDSDIQAAKAAGVKSIHLSPAKHKDAAAGITELSGLIEAIESLA